MAENEFDELLRQETVFERIIGAEEAVKKTADALFAGADEKTVKAEVAEIMQRKKIAGRDAKAAFRVLKEHWVSRFKSEKPLLAKVLGSIGTVGLSWKAVEETEKRVVFRVSNGKNCALLRACKHDVKKSEKFCRAHFKHQIPFDAESTLVLRAVNPRLKWELVKMRNHPADHCEYAIVLAD
ncbi:MAG: hypothetical protein WC792_05455 [Candidatus Micrarchaeia archaeon]